jgi:hypothetical protein
VNADILRTDLDPATGRQVVRSDNRGYRAKCIAKAMVREDRVTPYFDDPLTMENTNSGVNIILNLPTDVVEQLYKGFDKANKATKEARADVGKSSAKITSADS